jgi:hypothetical protein
MSGKVKGCLLGGILGYLLIILIALLVAANLRENLESPATASRDVYGFKEGHFGLLEKASRKTEAVWPPGEEMSVPTRIEGKTAGTFLLDWTTEAKPAAVGEPERWSETLVGDDRVELFAFASWVPQADDPHTDPDWAVPLTLRDPLTGEALTAERLAAEGVPESFSSFSPPRKYQTPLLRLLFKTSGMEHPRAVSMDAGDARTGARVSYDLQDENDGSPRHETIGAWLRADTDLLLWHDTPLTCHVRVLTGPPQMAELKQEPDAQTLIGGSLRVQWVGRTEREVEVRSSMRQFEPSPALPADQQEEIRRKMREGNLFNDGMLGVEPEADGRALPHALLRVSSRDLISEHGGLLTPRGTRWVWSHEETDAGLSLVSIPLEPADTAPLRIVFVPKIAELTFAIAALPDMPNPRGTADLFDCVLPRITLPEDLDDAETQLLGFICVGAQLAWESTERWDDHPPKALPAGHTFQNTSPQQLLDWYLDETPGAWVRYDPDNLLLHINEEEQSWWTRMKERFGILFGTP